ncbi:MAG: tRNA pseudouridine(38-40) synthase TruA [Alphaproteobacteria bacterium]|nr:tRNA pseudouridine(38-40) synthase TruA [Rickettsiales bacterium]
MPNKYAGILEYAGCYFCGMQSQQDSLTVQEVTQSALSRLFNENIIINFAGRTDSGVHALGQVIDFSTHNIRSVDQILRGANFYLPRKQISLLKVKEVPIDFDSRFNAKMRHYVYKIINRPVGLSLYSDTHHYIRKNIDIDLLKLAGEKLLGKHNFTSFRNPKCDKNPVRTLSFFDVKVVYQRSCLQEKELHIYFSAKSFLHNMVRKMMGAIIEVGIGNWHLNDIDKLLNIHLDSIASTFSTAPIAPAKGLYFLGVDYNNFDGFCDH